MNSRSRGLTISYTPHTEPVERHQNEQRLARRLQAELGEDVQVTFEELDHDRPWQRTRVRLTGRWDRAHDQIFALVARCLTPVHDEAA